jgi:hypothetical protein
MELSLLAGLLVRSALLPNRTAEDFPEVGVAGEEVWPSPFTEHRERNRALAIIKGSFLWKAQSQDGIVTPGDFDR